MESTLTPGNKKLQFYDPFPRITSSSADFNCRESMLSVVSWQTKTACESTLSAAFWPVRNDVNMG
jgi:hypothetical protein